MTINKKVLPSSLIVTQANELVSARYTLPLVEQRLVLTMISRIQPSDEDFKEYRLNISELAEFIGVDKNSAYRECKKNTENLLKRVLTIEEPGRLLQTSWVSSAEYIDGEGCVILCFDPKLKPYLLQLKGNFTSCNLEMLLSFKSQYTIRFYSLLKQYFLLKTREVDIQLLRDMLGLRADQHQEYSNFKNNILKPIQKELKARADLYFEFDEIKCGRKIGAIQFHILANKSIEFIPKKVLANVGIKSKPLPLLEANITPVLVELLLLVPEQHKSKKTVQRALESHEKKHGFDYVKRNVLYSNAKAAKSYTGFLNNSLKDDWGHDWDLEQQEVITKKTVEIWERQGFSSQKEYDNFMYHKQMESYGIKINEVTSSVSRKGFSK
jgi:plasmid replication initiation protein